jgi:hypothetical protein
MATPRIGRADRLATLPERGREIFPFVGRGGRPLNAASLIGTDWVTPLAELLTSLPTALHEIGERITRHGAGTTRDTELAQLVEMVRARTVDLWLAVERLRDAARPAGRAKEGA